MVESEAKHPPLALVVSLGAVEDRVPLNGEALHARHDGEYYVILLRSSPSSTEQDSRHAEHRRYLCWYQRSRSWTEHLRLLN